LFATSSLDGALKIWKSGTEMVGCLQEEDKITHF